MRDAAPQIRDRVANWGRQISTTTVTVHNAGWHIVMDCRSVHIAALHISCDFATEATAEFHFPLWL